MTKDAISSFSAYLPKYIPSDSLLLTMSCLPASVPPLRMVCVYLVLQLVMGVIIENVALMEKMKDMKVSEAHLQASAQN